jgi:hypothetical protein
MKLSLSSGPDASARTRRQDRILRNADFESISTWRNRREPREFFVGGGEPAREPSQGEAAREYARSTRFGCGLATLRCIAELH